MGLRRTRAESRGAQAPHDVGSQGVSLTSVETMANQVVTNLQWPAMVDLAYCAIEMMSFGTPRFGAARSGIEVFHASPRQADPMIVSGRVSHKMVPVVCDIYDKMTNPKWVVSMSVYASSGDMFNNYAIVQGCDHIIPVGVYLPGYPPRPEMLINAVFELRGHVKRNRRLMKGTHEAATRATKETALAAPDIHAAKGLLA